MPGREEFWNIGYPLMGALVYIVMVVAAVSIAYGLYHRYRFWRLGQPMPDLGPWVPRIKRFIALASVDILLHRRFLKKDLYPGLMHFFIFWGAVVLLIATTVGALEHNLHEYLHVTIFTTSYKLQFSLIWDIFGGLFATIGVLMALYRRYVIKPPRLNTLFEDPIILALILTLVVTGFIVEGLRVGATELNPASDVYSVSDARWSPIGFVFAKLFSGIGMSIGAMEGTHKALWWTHSALVAMAFAYGALAFNKLTHMIVSPVNAFFRSDRPKGALRPMADLETLETFGARDIKDFTWKQLLDFDACTNCGRCQDQCPAWASGKPLSPRKIIQDLKGYMELRAPTLVNAKEGEKPPEPEIPMFQHVSEEALWSCTTCRACMEVCPVFIEHIDSIVDMRRYLVMEEANMPETVTTALLSLESHGHPFRGTQVTRTDWTEGLGIKTMAEDSNVDVLFWVGCSAALEGRSQKMAQAMSTVLKLAGVNFAILGMEESCTGDPARRMGNEYLFQTMATQNIEILNGYDVKKIVTVCPHCMNTLKNEYPQFGGNYEVVHYTEFVNELIKEGRIKPNKTVEMTMAYHDSCYLGRHNGIYDDPREIAESIPGLKVVEMAKCREQGFCCGAGGGRMWMDEPGKRVSTIRTEHFLETGADTVGVSCPFCVQQLEEGVRSKGVEDTKKVRDLLEILVESATPDEPASG